MVPSGVVFKKLEKKCIQIKHGYLFVTGSFMKTSSSFFKIFHDIGDKGGTLNPLFVDLISCKSNQSTVERLYHHLNMDEEVFFPKTNLEFRRCRS